MDSVPILRIIIVILLIAASAFFSSAETAFTTVNKIQIQLMADEGSKKAERVLWILERTPKMLSAILIGNNIVNIAASALTTTIAIKMSGNDYVGLATGILTFIILLFGEVTPKTAATVYSQRFSLAYSGVIKACMIVLTPVIFIIEGLRTVICKILHIDINAKTETMTEDELKTLVDVSYEEGAIENDEFEMITNIFSLDEMLAKDIMVPQIDTVFVKADATYDELMDIYREYTFTRYPVYNDTPSTVIGTINMKDLLLVDKEDFSVRQILREPHFTFEHKEVGTLLIEMREASINIMVVLDEYGATSGIITMEDILEEIVGEIRDEYDKDETDDIIKLKRKNEYLIDGSTNLADVNDELGTELESEEYDTLGGYIIEYLDRLPKSGEALTLPNGIKMITEVVARNRIEKVHVIMPEEKTEE